MIFTNEFFVVLILKYFVGEKCQTRRSEKDIYNGPSVYK